MSAVNTEAQTVLTREQLLASPEDEYMSAPQLEFFRALLLKEKQALLDNAHETTEHLQENEATPDWTDRATIEEEHALELRVRDRERKLMKKIDQALARIDSGDYGWCEETGEPIGVPRLLARPTATMCLEAQERHEALERVSRG
ncbi:MAG TPA: RNA polymerase-binding protein DksA [Azoarcus taiwanensis]|uniref:RNA polymerase-binding transcription factor DksA n=1 Tax=Azoarcus taiwanensis TaxID=666964 RepID=A0A972J933_9RHOO|nr:RNA polymerase-binding protein DksA [Azoarcus taiwanensis]NMG02485.1 RNA polymerase-binding protein DksA [Azoarcus taiwanensis]HRQ58279.1 RNA polymerase-binding protein DksA [Azoarcus taiwanensis]